MVDQPITNLCIVSDKKNCPPRYSVLDRTVDNDDGDFWKDKFFKSKNFRYLCYTKEVSSNQLSQVVTDLALIGIKDPIPEGYTAITTTADSRDQALRKQVLCVRYVAKSMTNAAIVDICLFKDNSYQQRMYTLVGEANGINLTFKMAQILQPVRPAPVLPVANENPLMSPSPPVENQNSHHPHLQSTLPRQSKQMTGIEGVPFKLNEAFLISSRHGSPNGGTLQVTIRNLSELTRLTEYDFTQERKVVGMTS